MLCASDSDGKDDGNDYHDHDTSEYTYKMIATTGGIDTTTTTTTLSPPLSSSTSTSLLTDHDFPLDAIIKIVDCLSTKDTIHLSNSCQTLYTKIVIEWGGWECSSASCSTSSSVAAAASNSKSRPNRIFHALMEESGRRRHRNFLLSHSSRQQQRRDKQMTTMKMMMLQDSNDQDNDDRDNNYCRETAATTTTATATTTNIKNSFDIYIDIDIDIDNSVHNISSSDIVVGGCHRCQKRTCSDCTECCIHCTETLCSKGCCCEATDQKMSKCCKCNGSSNVVDGQRTTNIDNTNTTIQQQQQQQQHGIGLSCTDCEKYCDICQLYFCITCTERIIDHSSISNNNGTSSSSKKQAVQTQCGMCFVNKPHGGRHSCGIHTPSQWQSCSSSDCHRVMCYSCVYFCPQESCQVIYCNSCLERHTHCQQCGCSNNETMDAYNLYSDLT